MATKTTYQNIRLGVFVLSGTLLLLVAAYLIGNRQNLFADNLYLTTVFKNVNGLQHGNNVRFSGIAIGTVSKMEMINDTTIIVTMAIKRDMRRHIRGNAVATIGSDGLVGSMLINIVPAKGRADLVQDGDQLRSYSRISSQDMLNTLNVTNENAALLTSNLLTVTQRLMERDGIMGSLLNDTLMGQRLRNTLANLEKGTAKINSTLTTFESMIDDIEKGESMAGLVLKDSLSAVKVKLVLDELGHTVAGLGKVTDQMDSILVDFHSSKGIYHTLVMDTVMGSSLERTLRNIEAGTAKFDANMEALKHSFLTRRYFRKLERDSILKTPQ